MLKHELKYYIRKLTKGTIEAKGADVDFRILKGLIVTPKFPIMIARL